MFPTRINAGRPRIRLSYSHLKETAVSIASEAVILSPSLGRRVSGDACDRNADGEAPSPMLLDVSGGRAMPRAIKSEVSREVLHPKEGLRMTAPGLEWRRQNQ